MTRVRVDNPDHRARVLERTPLQRVLEPEDLVGALLFLASPASEYVTGHVLPIVPAMSQRYACARSRVLGGLIQTSVGHAGGSAKPSDASVHRRRIWTSAGCNCTFKVRAGPLVTAPLTSVIQTLPGGLSKTGLAPPALVRLLNWTL
jgi:Enoyl-(Acyl carrier protein) reductase